jgi:hypothetical protein
MKALHQPAEQRRNPRSDLRLGASAVRVGGIVCDIDDRRRGQQLTRALQDRKTADAGIEEEEGGVGVQGIPPFGLSEVEALFSTWVLREENSPSTSSGRTGVRGTAVRDSHATAQGKSQSDGLRKVEPPHRFATN